MIGVTRLSEISPFAKILFSIGLNRDEFNILSILFDILSCDISEFGIESWQTGEEEHSQSPDTALVLRIHVGAFGAVEHLGEVLVVL
jgi:hypothetical protein